MYIPFYSSPHLLPIDYKQAWLWRENQWDVDEWNQFGEKKNWSYLNEFIVIHNSIKKKQRFYFLIN